MGVSGIATELTLEQLAHNDGYDKHDIHGMCPSSNNCVDDACDQIIVSGINMEHVCQAVNSSGGAVKAVVSQDPGRYKFLLFLCVLCSYFGHFLKILLFLCTVI